MYQHFVRSFHRSVVNQKFQIGSNCQKVKRFSHLANCETVLARSVNDKLKCRQIWTTQKVFEKELQPIRRLVNPDSIDRDRYVETLCFGIQQSRPDRYGFISALVNKQPLLEIDDNGATSTRSPKVFSTKDDHQAELLDLINLFGKEGIEEKCLEKFQSWADKSKLSIAYTLYANNLTCDAFLTRLVRHMGPQIGSMFPEELVAMLIIIYLKKYWSPEDLYDVLDPTLLQNRLAYLISSNEISNAEVCAVCHGLKKIEGFVAKENVLRAALYNRLYNMAIAIHTQGESSPIENMALLHITVLLHQGSLVFHDELKTVQKLLKSFDAISHLLEARTAVKLMTFGLVRNLHNPSLTTSVLSRLVDEGDISYLSLRDMCGLLKFVVLVDLEKVLSQKDKIVLLDTITQELNMMADENCSVSDVANVLQAWSYLAQYNYFEMDKLIKLFGDINKVSEENVCRMSQEEMSNFSCSAAFQALFPLSHNQSDSLESASKSVISNLIRNIASLDQTLAVFMPEFQHEHGIRPDILGVLLRSNQTPVPIEARSPQMQTTNKLTKRQRLFVNIYREMARALDGENYVQFLHILPHFQEPDIVFGHIAGIKLSIPESLTGASSSSLKPAPDYGDWFVITSESRFVMENIAEQNTLEEKMGWKEKKEKYPKGSVVEPFKLRQLRALGYNVVTIDEDLRKNGLRPWVNKVVASILTGLEQGPPNVKAAPTM